MLQKIVNYNADDANQSDFFAALQAVFKIIGPLATETQANRRQAILTIHNTRRRKECIQHPPTK